ncbi:MFS transporter [Nocardia sp. CY41]|uniref:MFS transporter n=1 Tax=Nocardia sp. CY41 TaxID=2608686 RepID=UPI0013573029|nr:MFS transporter [Nocardia sp. CY41]
MTQVEEVVARRQISALRGALGVAAVTAGTFTVVTSEMLPVGLLTPIGAALRVTEGRAGLALTVTGSIAALSAPLVTAMLRRVERRLVLCGLMAVLALGNLGTACAPGFSVLIGARVLVGVGFLGALAGWRMVFVAAACLALAVLVAMAALLPRLPATEALPLRDVLRLTRQPGLRVALLVVAFLVTGHFAAYTYVRPVLEEVSGVDAATIGTLLLVYGVAGVAGNFAAGAVAARTPRGTLVAIGSILAAAAIALPAPGASLTQVVVLMIVWGVSYGGVSVSTQSWVFAASPQAKEGASALFAGVFNAAIALGSLTGGVAADEIGVAAAMWLGGTLAVVAVLIAALGKGVWRC